MSFYSDTQTPSHVTWLVNAVAGMVAAGLRQALQIVKSRRDAAVLAGLDDRMLADIGLTRGDVRDAVSEPAWRDPTTLLVSRARERRFSRRRGPEMPLESPSIVPSAAVSGVPVRTPYY